MPDRRRHRGKHPQDESLFAEDQLPGLRQAVTHFCWLRTRGYAENSALKLVGDRHNLTVRQRMAVWRSSCSDGQLENRRRKETRFADLGEARLAIDGYNLLITIESALSGGLILIGRDGCYRDLASVHGTYRRVQETVPAFGVVLDCICRLDVERVDWYLDRPVSNSGRLKTLMAEQLEARLPMPEAAEKFNIELVGDPDAILSRYPGNVVSSDSLVLDNCGAWVNLAAVIVAESIPWAWRLDLCEGAHEDLV